MVGEKITRNNVKVTFCPKIKKKNIVPINSTYSKDILQFAQMDHLTFLLLGFNHHCSILVVFHY